MTPAISAIDDLLSHPLDPFCLCTPCRRATVLRVDAFCFGLVAGLQLVSTAFDGDATMALPLESLPATLRPPRR